ncbi:MAG: hypothetical protein ACLGRW_11485 [Acidobacteriota bacterium]
MPPVVFKEIRYEQLNGRQQEAHNFQKLSAVLADFGFITIPLNNDWNGADFIAQMHDGTTFIKVQLKSRLTFDAKYCRKQLYICFRDGSVDQAPWYMYDHDELLAQIIEKIQGTATWKAGKPYHFPALSPHLKKLLEPYRVPRGAGPAR